MSFTLQADCTMTQIGVKRSNALVWYALKREKILMAPTSSFTPQADCTMTQIGLKRSNALLWYALEREIILMTPLLVTDANCSKVECRHCRLAYSCYFDDGCSWRFWVRAVYVV